MSLRISESSATIKPMNLEQMISQMKKQKNFRNMIKFSNQNYQVKAYKIEKLKPSQLKETLNQINIAYQAMDKQENQKKGKGKKKYVWVVNELKLFVWLLMAYSFLNQINIIDYTEEDWKFFEEIFIEKTTDYLQFQSKLFLKNYKGNSEKWDQEQQNLLKQIISDQEIKGKQNLKWNDISKALYFNSNKRFYRQPQKCREHWFNHLDPEVKRQTWTYQEDLLLVQIIKQCGFKWSLVTKYFKGTRTEHMVKNRAKYLFKKYGGQQQAQEGSSKKLLKRIQKRLKSAIEQQNNPKIQQESEQASSQQKSQTKIKKSKKKETQHNIQKKQKINSVIKVQNSQTEKQDPKVKIQFQERQIQMNERLKQKGFSASKNLNPDYGQNKIPEPQSNSNIFKGNIFSNINPMQISKHNFIKNEVYFITAPIHQNVPYNPSFGFSPYQHEYSNNMKSNNPQMFKTPPQNQVYFKPREPAQKPQKPVTIEIQAKDQYGIIQQFSSQEQQINLNLDQIRFNHERDGGKMRERITHELQALFNNMNQQDHKPDFSQF